MSGKGCGIQQSCHPPHPHPNLAIFVTGLWVALCGTAWCGSASSVIVILGGGGEVSHSYALQELPPEGRFHTSKLRRNSHQRGVLTLLHSAGTPTGGEVSHF